MDVRAMINEANFLLSKLDLQFAAAQRAFGIRPNLVDAEEKITVAGATVFELGNVLAELQSIGLQHPPDVIQRLRDKYQALHQMAFEVNQCKNIVIVRSRWGKLDKHGLN